MIKKILTILVVTLLGAAMMALVGASYYKRSGEFINTVVVRVCRNTESGFLNNVDLEKAINPKDTLLKFKLYNISEKSIERKLSSNPFIEQVDCYVGLNGEVFVNVKERNPVVRVYEKSNSSYYLDENGIFFPSSKQFAPRVIIANGYIGTIRQKNHSSIYDSVYFNTPLFDLFKLVNYIRDDDFLNAQISQIYYNSLGEWELVPELGDHIIKFGKLDNMDKKFENLKTFYKELSRLNGWNNYQIINLTYSNQIVCTKK